MPVFVDLETALAVAQGALDTGNAQAAAEFYEVALAQFPHHIEVLEAYAEVLIHYLNQPERAIQLLRHATEVSPDAGYVKFLSLAQLCEGREALAYYGNATRIMMSELSRTKGKTARDELRRELASAKSAMAELFLTDLCEEEDAEQQCELLINDAELHCEGCVEVHHIRASLRISQCRQPEAAESLRRAVGLCRSLPEELLPPYETMVDIGKLFMQVSPDEAFPCLLDVLSLNDANPYVWFLLGETARLRRRYEDSARLLRRARLMVAPTNVEGLTEIDGAIRVLVEEMGGAEEVSRVPHMDAPNPLDFLAAEAEDEAGSEDVEED